MAQIRYGNALEWQIHRGDLYTLDIMLTYMGSTKEETDAVLKACQLAAAVHRNQCLSKLVNHLQKNQARLSKNAACQLLQQAVSLSEGRLHRLLRYGRTMETEFRKTLECLQELGAAPLSNDGSVSGSARADQSALARAIEVPAPN